MWNFVSIGTFLSFQLPSLCSADPLKSLHCRRCSCSGNRFSMGCRKRRQLRDTWNREPQERSVTPWRCERLISVQLRHPVAPQPIRSSSAARFNWRRHQHSLLMSGHCYRVWLFNPIDHVLTMQNLMPHWIECNIRRIVYYHKKAWYSVHWNLISLSGDKKMDK